MAKNLLLLDDYLILMIDMEFEIKSIHYEFLLKKQINLLENNSTNLPCGNSLVVCALERRDGEFAVPLLCCCAPDIVIRPEVYGLFEREREDVFVFVTGDDERSVVVGQEPFFVVEQEGLFERFLLVARRLFGDGQFVVVVVV
jgi:hypothetical protein